MRAQPRLPAAVLWDMDGLLVDSEPLWTIAETELCARLGGVFTPEMKADMVGHRLDSAVPILLHHFRDVAHFSADAGVIATWLLERMVELFAAELPLLPGALDLLRALADAHVPCALVSSSYRALVDPVLTVLTHRLGTMPFAASVAGDEVINAKPHPEPFATAARLLDVAPEHCVVLEDSAAGVRSGLAAGAQVLLIPSVPGVAEIGAAQGWRVRDSLVGLTPSGLLTD